MHFTKSVSHIHFRSIFVVLLCLNFYIIPGAFGQAASKNRVTVLPKNLKPQYGTASYYAKKFEGRKTATGETYNGAKFTAACNTLPLRTWVKVTNLRNKRSVIVRINDRLHYKNTRLVDLSYVAARQLGYTSHGLAKVKVEVLRNYKVSKK